jgi:rSAM/selenodomain-associated transferase 2
MISVVIPTHNEAAHLPITLNAVAANERQCEVIVADASSGDATVELANAGGAHVVDGLARNRGAQMNLGARSAHGDTLLFLHADTLVPATALERIETALENPAIVGGGFARRYDSPSRLLRCTCRLAELRCRWFGWFLGDQAIFVRRTVFDALGGFRECALFEDLDFSRRLARQGRVTTIREPVISSARRFEALGPWRTTWNDFAMTCGYLRGEPPAAVAARRPPAQRPPAPIPSHE